MSATMQTSAVEAFLERSIGLDVASVGPDLIRRAVRERMGARGCPTAEAYLAQLQAAEAERQALIDTVVVLETWFFRNHAAFEFLRRYVREEWLPAQTGGKLRVLSLPCATGEEAYTLVMTLLEAGLAAERFHVDALDISRAALEIAERGSYGPASFRNHQAAEVRPKYFTDAEEPGKFTLRPEIRRLARFAQANLLDPALPAGRPAYNIIFCRNLLIYLTSSAKERAVANLRKLLGDDGILFVGHAERTLVCASGFVQVRQPGVFACRKAVPVPDAVLQAGGQTPRHFERRSRAEKGDASLFNTGGKSNKKGSVPFSPFFSPFSSVPPLPRAAAPAAPQAERRHPPGPIIDTLDEARRLADQGLLHEALRLCQHCLEQKPDHAQANFLTALVYQALNDTAQAEVYFNKTLYLDPEHLEALHYLAFLIERRGGKEAAARLRQRLQRLRRRGNG